MLCENVWHCNIYMLLGHLPLVALLTLPTPAIDVLVHGLNSDTVKMCVEIYLDIHTSSAKQRLRHLLIIFADFTHKLQAN